jgi:pantetheine-phosphate adenylyltransferase
MVDSVIYPGTFDPITYGHLDIIERTSKMFKKIVVGIIKKPVKSNFMFDYNERFEFVKQTTEHLDNVEIKLFDGLLIDFAKSEKINVIIRGLRAITDFEIEFQMSLINKKLAPEIEMIYMMTNQKYSYLSSSMVKEIASFNGNVSCFVNPLIAGKLTEKFNCKNTLS